MARFLGTTARSRDTLAPRKVDGAAAVRSLGRSVVAGVLAIAIFLFDTITPFDIAVAVLYVAVVLMSINARWRHGVVIASLVCAALTILSFVITHGVSGDGEAVGRALVSLTAIGIKLCSP